MQASGRIYEARRDEFPQTESLTRAEAESDMSVRTVSVLGSLIFAARNTRSPGIERTDNAGYNSGFRGLPRALQHRESHWQAICSDKRTI